LLLLLFQSSIVNLQSSILRLAVNQFVAGEDQIGKPGLKVKVRWEAAQEGSRRPALAG